MREESSTSEVEESEARKAASRTSSRSIDSVVKTSRSVDWLGRLEASVCTEDRPETESERSRIDCHTRQYLMIRHGH